MLCRSLSHLQELLSKEQGAEFFAAQQKALRQMLPLQTFLLKPVQRVLKYQLLLKVGAIAFRKNNALVEFVWSSAKFDVQNIYIRWEWIARMLSQECTCITLLFFGKF